MELSGKTVGFCMTCSFCTFSKAINAVSALAAKGANVIPIMSANSYSTDTRFGKCEEFRKMLTEITGNEIIKSIKEAEPIGPKGYLDLLIIAPCTGNTLAKLAAGIADTSVTMAAKAHLRNQKPVLIAVSTNDGLAASAKNIGALLNYKNVYFTPFGQDDCVKKPNSLVAEFDMLIPSARAALDFKQLQPIIR